jgi:predicted phosphodiesterase
MRIALISDIHGNLVSFEAVLADIERQQVNEIIFLGDAATLGPQPHEVLARLKEIGCPLGHAYMRGTQWFTDTLSWCRSLLRPEDYKFIRSFRSRLKISLDADFSLLCFHGSPRSNTENIFATTSVSKVDEMLAGYQATVMAGGHTHVQMMRQHKGLMIINAGSVGMPFEQMPFKDGGPRIMPWAEYTILAVEGGVVSADLRRIAVDMDAVRQAAIDSKMPEITDWLNNWVTFSR